MAYEPLIKKKNFQPSPVARYGVPDIADSYSNPNVIGTVAYEDWWNEQIERCINGYHTGGMFIPGRYYWYLNFCKISTIERGVHYPEYVDVDYEFFLMVEQAKKERKGGITIKKRRCGVSWKFAHGVVGYGVRFANDGYLAGIVAGNQDYSKGFFDKFKYSLTKVADEFKLHELNKNQEYWRAGYEIKNINGVSSDSGSLNIVMCKTAGKSAAVFKGEAMADCIFEESGEFNNLLDCYTDTKACFKGPSGYIGTPFILGCVCAGTKVWDNNGTLVNIEDLKPENGILGYDGNGVSKEKITYWQSPREKECYRITTNKMRVLECSDDHPILWSKKGFNFSPRDRGDYEKRIHHKKTKFVEAKDIKPGDQIAVIEAVPIYGNKKMWEPRLIGWLIGDGTYGIDHSPRMASCDKEVTDHLLKKFNSKVTKSHLTKDGKVYEEIRIKGICGKLRELGIYGQTKLNKRLPVDVHSYRKKDICELLGGFFDADGSVNINSKTGAKVTLTASGFELIFEVKLLLQKLGIHCNISKIKARQKTDKIKGYNDYYTLGVSDVKSIKTFRDHIHFKIGYKQRKLEYICEQNEGKRPHLSTKGLVDGLRFERVVSVEPIGKKLVYNLTAGTTHTYIANGIVTHNTGGNIKSASKDFKEMYYDADNYNLIPFNILGPRLFLGMFVGSKDEKGKEFPMPPNIAKLVKDKKLSPEQVLGCEDTVEATKIILEDRKKLATAKDKKLYYGHLQDNPLSEKEAFLSFSGNDFSPEKLAEQSYMIGSLSSPNYSKYRLEFVKDDKGMIKTPLEVVAIPEKDSTPEEGCVLILQHPEKEYKNLDIAGIDSYDIDKSATSKSLGAIVVFRRYNNIIKNGIPLASKKPIAVYYFRPERKEMFYEICLKLCVYYNLKHNALIDIRNSVIIKYFEQYGGEKYLAKRPLAFETENSEQAHEYGVSLNVYSKPKMISLLQTWVLDHVTGCWFPRIIEDLQGYDVSAKASDWDAADALGIALMRDADMAVMVTGDQQNKYEAADLPKYSQDGSGNMVLKNIESGNKGPAFDPFIRMIEEGEI